MTAHRSFSALGSTAVVITSEGAGLERALPAVAAVVEAFDRACSRFRVDSELSAVNRAGGRPVRVGPVLLEAVQAGVRAAQLTDGDVDPALGIELARLGYDRDFDLGLEGRGRIVDPAGGLRLAGRRGWRTIRIDPSAATIALGRGVQLDLGATAKALAADRAAGAAREAAGCGVLVGLGGDLATAGPAPEAGWRVRVTDDHRAASEPGQWITIDSGGLATSSTAVRRWRTADGACAHHLIDPRQGGPVGSPWRTVSVAAGSCLDANVAATAALVRGERAVGWLLEQGLPARLVDDEGRALHVAGWPTAGEELPLREPAEVPA